MSRWYMVIAGLFLSGALLCGIGGGVCFAQYSQFEYAGDVVLPGSRDITKTVEYELPKKLKDHTVYLDMNTYYHVVEDPTVPMGILSFTFRYVTDTDPKPEIQVTDTTPSLVLWAEDDYAVHDERAAFKLKDQVLSDLKQHKIGSYQMDGTYGCEVRVNPKTKIVVADVCEMEENEE